MSEPSREGGGSSSGRTADTGLRFRVELEVDGRRVELKEFIHDMVGGAVVGLLGGLRGIEDPKRIRIDVTRR